jgi:hypothetical protein
MIGDMVFGFWRLWFEDTILDEGARVYIDLDVRWRKGNVGSLVKLGRIRCTSGSRDHRRQVMSVPDQTIG